MEGLNLRHRYRAYLLRCWEASAADGALDDAAIWRYSLEDPHTGERRGFPDLAVLVTFLQATQTVPAWEAGGRGTESAYGAGAGGRDDVALATE